jgi:predicted acetyltransferase
MSTVVRRCADRAEVERAMMAIGQYFGMEAVDAEMRTRFERLMPVDRMHAAWDGDEIVGGTGALPFELSVPGATIHCSGTTIVGVAPTHRRRGVLRSMMLAQLEDVHARGVPVAALWASEEGIYGRFGYGRASFAGEIEVPRDHAAFNAPVEPRGSVRLVDTAEALERFPPVWNALARARPGMVMRSREWWEDRTLGDAADRRDGAGPKRLALLELHGAPAGYAIYRHKMAWEGGSSAGKVMVVEAIAAEAAAAAAVWRYLLDVDWVATISSSVVPPDHPLFFLLAQPRRMRYRMGDGLWIRLVDVGAALAGRTYPEDGDVVLDVRDELCPWNERRWRLAGGVAEPTHASADVALDVSTLGATYLGGMSLAKLAQGGHVEEREAGAIERADGIFRHGLHPWCPEIF